MTTSKLIDCLAARSGRLFQFLHHGFALIGLIAVVVVASSAGRPAVPVENEETAAGGAQVAGDTGAPFSTVANVEDGRFRGLATYLSRRYRVASDATERVIGIAFDVGARFELDPLLILAVIAVESGFNPIAESVVGAKGLMQVIPKFHQDKLGEPGDEASVLNPETNVLVGARILKDYIRRAGSLESGLQWYNGAPNDSSSQFAQKVMAEQERIRDVILHVGHPARKPPTA